VLNGLGVDSSDLGGAGFLVQLLMVEVAVFAIDDGEAISVVGAGRSGAEGIEDANDGVDAGVVDGSREGAKGMGEFFSVGGGLA